MTKQLSEINGVLAVINNHWKQISAEPPEPEESVMIQHANCWKHKNRIAHQQCEVCTRPWCSECLVTVLGQEVCPKCRSQGYGE